jgi:hypothetical protein
VADGGGAGEYRALEGGAGEYLADGAGADGGIGRLFCRAGTEGWLGNMGNCSGCRKLGCAPRVSGSTSFLKADHDAVRSLGGSCGGPCREGLGAGEVCEGV